MASSLINASPIPLIGLVLIRIAAEIYPRDYWIQRCCRSCSQIAIAACIGFLLLIPLQFSACLLQFHKLDNANTHRIDSAERQLKALHQAVASSRSNTDLKSRLQALQGPILGPADLVLPYPLLKAQVNEVLQQAEQQIAREHQRVPFANPWQLVAELLRNTIASLAMAIGFSALAIRPGADFPLLLEWKQSIQRHLRQLKHYKSPKGRKQEAEYFRKIIRKDEYRR